MMVTRALPTLAVTGLLLLAACGADGDENLTLATTPSTTTSTTSTTTTNSVPVATVPPTTVATTAVATTEPTATLADPSVDDPAVVASTTGTGIPRELVERLGEPIEISPPTFVVGHSVEGRPITAYRLGTEGGRRVLVIGVIHGNEDAGLQIIDELNQRTIDDSVELWIVDSMNPDGLAIDDRHNANGVDLNRNFPYDWAPIGQLGDGQYAGTGPASEPETQAMVDFITWLRPDITIWYHQDANLIIPSTGRDGRIRARYAELTNLPIADCCDGGIYTGIAATWARHELKRDSDAVPFIVELPGGVLPDDQVQRHATAVLTIAAEG